MLTTHQGYQHSQLISLICGLGKDLTINDHGRPATYGLPERINLRCVPATYSALDVGNGGLVCKRSFVNCGDTHSEANTDMSY